MLSLLDPEFSCQLTPSLFFPFVFLLHLLQPEDREREINPKGEKTQKERKREIVSGKDQ